MSKKTIILISFIIIFSCLAYHHIPGSVNENIQNQAKVPTLLEKQTPVNPTLLSLLEALSITHENTFESIVNATQKAWLRKPGQERWDLNTMYSPNINSLIISHCKQLNMIDQVIPHSKHFKYALIMGASLETIRNRFAFLLNLIEQGVSFDSIVFLTGQRPLKPTLESAEKLLDVTHSPLPINPEWSLQGPLPGNETEMISMVINQTKLSKNIASKILIIDTPCKTNAAGNLVRPTTGDTFASWLKNEPTPGTALVISSQPYVGYQDMVARSYLPSTFTIESAGCKHKEPIIDSDLLDTLARWIYQTNLYLEKQ